MLFVDICSDVSELGNNPHDNMSFTVLRVGNNALHHCLSAMYSAYVELSDI
jgi:hypothetical protein